MPRASDGTPPHARVLVTGAGGFVGRHVIDALLASGWKADAIVAAAHTDDAKAAADVQSFPLDLASDASCAALVRAARASVIIHLAGIAAPGKAAADRERAFDINFRGVRRLCDSALNAAPTTRFVFAGTSEVYGESFRDVDGPISEDAPLRPRSAYGESKAAADDYLSALSRAGADIIRMRAFNHTGPGQTADFVTPAFARQVARIERGAQLPVIDVGNLDARRDFLDVRDVARAYALAAAPARPAGARVFNIASGAPRRIGDILHALLALSPAAIEVRQDAARMRGPEIPVVCGEASRAASDLGWRPSIPFETTLLDTLNDWRARAEL